MNFTMKWNALFLVFLCLFILMVQIVTLKDSPPPPPSSPAPSSDDSDYDEYSDETPKKRRGSAVCPLLSLTNGRVRLRSRGRIAKFLCRVGFQAFGKRFATCIRGRWNAQPPLCISRGCPTFIPPPNGRMSMEYRGALLNFACNPGFTLVGSRSLYCDGSKWNSTAPNCEVSVKNPQLTCDFERDDLCGWSHDPTHDFDWKRFNLVTPSGHVGTGPSHDHTLGEGRDGYYMYIEASSPRVENDTARLFSPVYKATESQNACFKFWYHMYGATSGFLRVYVKPASGDFSSLLPKFNVGGDQGNKWHFGFVAISSLTEPFQIVIEGIRGPSYVSDTAIDDVQLTSGSDCILSADDNSTVLSTFPGPDVSTLSASSPLSTEFSEMITTLTPRSELWSHSTFSSVLPDVIPTISSNSSVSEAKKIDLETTTPLPPTFASSATSISTSVSSTSAPILTITTPPPSNTLSSIDSTSTLRTQQPQLKTTSHISTNNNNDTKPISLLTTSKSTFSPRTTTTITTQVTKTTTVSQRRPTMYTTTTTRPRTSLTPTTTTKKLYTTTTFPTVVTRKPTTQISKVISTVSPKTTTSVKSTKPPPKTEKFTSFVNPWTKVVTSGPLSLKNVTRSTTRSTTTTTTTTPRSTTTTSTTKSMPKTSQTQSTLTPTTQMPTKPVGVTPVVRVTLPPTEKSNEIEIFPDETETFVDNGSKARPLPPWTYMKRPSSVDRDRDRIFGNVAAAHVADGPFSVATGAGIVSVLVVVIGIAIFLTRRIRLRNEGRQDALNEDSDVRYLKDGEVRVEFCDLHLRYIGREDDSGL